MINPDEQTMDYYHRNAAGFVAGTVNASLDQSLARFAELLPAGGCVLDWGCGSGRDSLALRKLGFEVTSVDASPSMAAEALAATGTTVRVETFGELSEDAVYDGIWACASLLHVKPDDCRTSSSGLPAPSRTGECSTARLSTGALRAIATAAGSRTWTRTRSRSCSRHASGTLPCGARGTCGLEGVTSCG